MARSQCHLELGNADAALADAEATLEDNKEFIQVSTPRGVEIAGALGHGYPRTVPRCVLPVQMSGRALEGPKDQKSYILASICPTEKYNLSNRIRISHATHFHTHLTVLHSFSV